MADEGLAIAVAEPSRQLTSHIADQILLVAAGGAALLAPTGERGPTDLDGLLDVNGALYP